MNDLLMSGNLSERLSASSLTAAVVTFFFNDNKLSGKFVSLEAVPGKKSSLPTGLIITISVDEQDQPFKYFGLKASKVIINTGSEVLSFAGDFNISTIEKNSNYLIKLGATKYEKIIRNEPI